MSRIINPGNENNAALNMLKQMLGGASSEELQRAQQQAVAYRQMLCLVLRSYKGSEEFVVSKELFDELAKDNGLGLFETLDAETKSVTLRALTGTEYDALPKEVKDAADIVDTRQKGESHDDGN